MLKDTFQWLYLGYFVAFCVIVVTALRSLPPSPTKRKLGMASGLLSIAICVTVLVKNHLAS